MKVQVQEGDVSKVKAEALITAINSGGMWMGGIDGVIQRAAGSSFHAQAQQAMPLSDGQTVVAKGGDSSASFSNVVFVVDDLKQPLSNVVKAGLMAANQAGCRSVTLPTIRMGVMLGVVEKTKDEAIRLMAEGVNQFTAENPDTIIESVTFVVYGDAETTQALEAAFK